MTIRPATPHDVTNLVALVDQLGYSGDASAVAERLDALSKSDGDAVFVADADRRVIGFIHVRIERTIESAPYGEVRGLVVDEHHRSDGVGRALLDAAEQWIAGRGMRRVRVRSNVTRERARRFYERKGYRVTKVSNVFEKDL